MQTSLLDRLFSAGLLIDTGVDGLYGRGGAFEDVIARFEALIGRHAPDATPEVIRFPPGMNRAHFEGSVQRQDDPLSGGKGAPKPGAQAQTTQAQAAAMMQAIIGGWGQRHEVIENQLTEMRLPGRAPPAGDAP